MLRESVVLHESFFGIKAGPPRLPLFLYFLEADVAMISLQRSRPQFQKPLGLTQLENFSRAHLREILQDPETLS